MPTAAWIALAIVVVIVVYGITLYNKLVRHRNLVQEGYSGIDVQLTRRSDLIPNLLETVKGYAAHEKALFADIAERRASSINAGSIADKAVADKALTGALGRLFAVAEAYPDLKADANFRALQADLSEIEDQLQMARRYYNGTARDYNIVVESFPNVLVAGSFGFRKEPFFELADPATAAVPKVAF